MKRFATLMLLVLPLGAQQFKLDFSHLEGKATDTLDISLTHSTLQFAAKCGGSVHRSFKRSMELSP